MPANQIVVKADKPTKKIKLSVKAANVSTTLKEKKQKNKLQSIQEEHEQVQEQVHVNPDMKLTKPLKEKKPRVSANKKSPCEYCESVLSRQDSLARHKKTCSKFSQFKAVELATSKLKEEYDAKIKVLEQQVETLTNGKKIKK
jgi:uncharacterized Zn-finger protein